MCRLLRCCCSWKYCSHVLHQNQKLKFWPERSRTFRQDCGRWCWFICVWNFLKTGHVRFQASFIGSSCRQWTICSTDPSEIVNGWHISYSSRPKSRISVNYVLVFVLQFFLILWYSNTFSIFVECKIDFYSPAKIVKTLLHMMWLYIQLSNENFKGSYILPLHVFPTHLSYSRAVNHYLRFCTRTLEFWREFNSTVSFKISFCTECYLYVLFQFIYSFSLYIKHGTWN